MAEAGTESRTELVKAGPGSPCWNRPGHPEAFKAAAWKVRWWVLPASSALSLPGSRPTRRTQVNPDLSGHFLSHPLPLHRGFCHTYSSHTTSWHTYSPPQLLPVIPAPIQLLCATPTYLRACHTRSWIPTTTLTVANSFFPKMATTISLIIHALLAMWPWHSSRGVVPPIGPSFWTWWSFVTALTSRIDWNDPLQLPRLDHENAFPSTLLSRDPCPRNPATVLWVSPKCL